MKIYVKGLNSCGMRKTDVQRYKDFLDANGYELVDHPGQSDKILLWTCGFRRDSRDNSLSEIQRYVKEYDAELIVGGCLPSIDEQLLREKFKGKVVVWKNDDEQFEQIFGHTTRTLAEMPRQLVENQLCEDVAEFKQSNPDKDASFIDQFNKLFTSHGCRFECSYCSERLAFPPYQSYPLEDLYQACADMVRRTQVYDVILLGDSIGDYGHDIGSNLPELIRKLKTIHPSLRFAIQGYNPAHFLQFLDDMVEFIEKDYIRHMQLPIQSASERILKLMKRPYNRADIDTIFTLLNEKQFTWYDTHLIFGFPGEQEEDVDETIEFVLRHRPNYVLLSGFMDSPTMPAHHLPDKVDSQTTRHRIHDAERRIKAAGIICNSDDSELSQQRFHTINAV